MAARSSLLLSSLAQGLPIALFTFVLCFSVSVILLALMEPRVLRGWARRFLESRADEATGHTASAAGAYECAPRAAGRGATKAGQEHHT